jgi:hypothetical protein
MSLLFLSAKDHRIKSHDLDRLHDEFVRLNPSTSQEVLNYYQARRLEGAAKLDQHRLPQLHAV